MNDSKIISINSAAGKIRHICDCPHAPLTKCERRALVNKILRIQQENKVIPSIMAVNNETMIEATACFKMAQDAGKAIMICEQVVMEFDNGPNIWDRFQKRLEEVWPRKIISPATEELQPQEGLSTPNETPSKLSTEETTPGGSTATDSSPSTGNFTRVEHPLLP